MPLGNCVLYAQWVASLSQHIIVSYYYAVFYYSESLFNYFQSMLLSVYCSSHSPFYIPHSPISHLSHLSLSFSNSVVFCLFVSLFAYVVFHWAALFLLLFLLLFLFLFHFQFLFLFCSRTLTALCLRGQINLFSSQLLIVFCSFYSGRTHVVYLPLSLSRSLHLSLVSAPQVAHSGDPATVSLLSLCMSSVCWFLYLFAPGLSDI